MINVERLQKFFIELAKIPSPSRREGEVAKYFREQFLALKAKILIDDSAPKTGSDTGNHVIKLFPEKGKPLLFLAAHFDTVEPADNPKIIFENGLFKTDGRTVLGADDKSALAIFLEVAHVLAERKLEIPIEFICTTCEEIGLLGAKNLDFSLIEAPFGYALDSEDPQDLINRAPEAIRFSIWVFGKAAHAGLNPEEGINAIKLAAEALTQIQLGRLDRETTANIGLIRGGKVTNIVPEEVTLEGEIRSHVHAKVEENWQKIVRAFETTIDKIPKKDGRPALKFEVFQDYPLMHVSEDHPLIQLALAAAKEIALPLRIVPTGGGSDANIFNDRGLPCVILGTGMRQVHSTQEYLPLDDFIKSCQFALELVLQAAKQL